MVVLISDNVQYTDFT